MRFLLVAVLALVASAQTGKPPAGFRALFNGRNLDGWEGRGDGQWIVLTDGTLTGQRVWDKAMIIPGKTPFTDSKTFLDWWNTQAWLYTTQEYGDFDLHVEFWTRTAGNSGISIRDSSRAANAIGKKPDFTKTPARTGYEIQINNRYPDPTPTASVYLFTKAPKELMKEDQWNAMDIEARKETIRVLLNGKLASDAKCDPQRPTKGPIGLQLHDQSSVILFRNIWIRER